MRTSATAVRCMGRVIRAPEPCAWISSGGKRQAPPTASICSCSCHTACARSLATSSCRSASSIVTSNRGTRFSEIMRNAVPQWIGQDRCKPIETRWMPRASGRHLVAGLFSLNRLQSCARGNSASYRRWNASGCSTPWVKQRSKFWVSTKG